MPLANEAQGDTAIKSLSCDKQQRCKPKANTWRKNKKKPMFVVDYVVGEVGKKRKNKLKTDAGEGIGDKK